MDLKRLAKSSALYSVGGLARRLFSFILLPVYTRYLTPADYGILELLEVLITVSSMLLGMNAVGSAMVRIYHDSKDPKWQNDTYSTALIWNVLISGLMATCGALASGVLAPAYLGSADYAPLLVLAFFAVVPGTMTELGFSYLRVRDEPFKYVVMSIAYLLCNVTLNVVFIVGLHWGVWGFVWAKMITNLLAAGAYAFMHVRRTGLHWDREIAKRIFVFGRPLIIVAVAMQGLHFFDRFVLKLYVSLAAIGIYGLAYKFGSLVIMVIGQPFDRAFGARLFAHTDEADWKQTAGQALTALCAMSLFAGLGIAACADETIVVIAHPDFHGAGQLVPLLAAANVLRSVGDFFRVLLHVNKRSGLAARMDIACLVFNVGSCFLLIPWIGVWGAAWATLFTWGLFLCLNYWFAEREHAIPVDFRRIGVLTVLACALYGLMTLVDGPGPFASGAIDLAICLLYVPLAWITVIPAWMKADLRAWWLRRRARRAAP
ncbi:MAG: lipopolysaccharide biosynthesis protein [Planctomycetota bacterium]|jgi:O-antigen/teichoic acid export membrane protein